MWRFFKPSPLLLLIATTTLQRGNAELGCDSRGWLRDKSKCWAGDINRVFCWSLSPDLEGCIKGHVSIFIGCPPPLCNPPPTLISFPK